jgi:hypothetical protein
MNALKRFLAKKIHKETDEKIPQVSKELLVKKGIIAY